MTAMSNEIWTAILEAIDEGIHVVDEQGYTIYYNRIAAQLDGLKQKEVLGKHLLDIFPSLDIQTSTLLKVIESREPIYNQHQRFTNIKGKVVVTVNSTLPLMVDGKCVGAVEISKDISRVKELSEKLVDLQAQMAQKQLKPVKGQELKQTIENGTKYTFIDIISQDQSVERLKVLATRAAATTSPVMVTGETGTGKELVVQSIHNASRRSQAPFIAQNCAALPATLLEGLLFGTTKGSFTGAEDRPGLFELANGGTLFLDEINSMPLELQAKLLRVIQEERVRRIGGPKESVIDVRIITALNEEPLDAVKEGRLRTDLYYRLNVVSFRIPPLRERKEDIFILVHHFIKRFNYRFGKLVTDISKEVMELFRQYDWPGNVRELEHTIEAAMNLVEGDLIHVIDLPPSFQQHRPIGNGEEGLSLREALKGLEEKMIREAMLKTGGNIMGAAKLLGVPRQTLQYKLSKMGLGG